MLSHFFAPAAGLVLLVSLLCCWFDYVFWLSSALCVRSITLLSPHCRLYFEAHRLWCAFFCVLTCWYDCANMFGSCPCHCIILFPLRLCLVACFMSVVLLLCVLIVTLLVLMSCLSPVSMHRCPDILLFCACRLWLVAIYVLQCWCYVFYSLSLCVAPVFASSFLNVVGMSWRWARNYTKLAELVVITIYIVWKSSQILIMLLNTDCFNSNV